MVLGKTAKMRLSAHSSRKWYIGREESSETDEQHHLGILRTVFTSTIHRTSERCTAARSSFFALNSIGSMFGCLHPLTSYRLYQTLCIPILLYGAEIWTLSKVELNMLEQVHRNILHTIQGLPTCCHSSSHNHISPLDCKQYTSWSTSWRKIGIQKTFHLLETSFQMLVLSDTWSHALFLHTHTKKNKNFTTQKFPDLIAAYLTKIVQF